MHGASINRLNNGAGEPLAAISFRILGIPVERPSVISNSFRNSPIRRLR